MKTIVKSKPVITTTLMLPIGLIILILSMTSCLCECIEGNHHLITEDRETGAFHEIVCSGSLHVTVIPDSVTSVQVKGESNVIPYVYTQCDGHSLSVGFRNCYNILENYPVEVLVHTPELDLLRVSGSGSILSYGFEADKVMLQVSGSGKIDCDFDAYSVESFISGSGSIMVSGKAMTSSHTISGSGNINSLEMQQQHCNVKISGSGDVFTDVVQSLDATISGSGCIYYTGEPAITTHISGSGKVIKF